MATVRRATAVGGRDAVNVSEAPVSVPSDWRARVLGPSASLSLWRVRQSGGDQAGLAHCSVAALEHPGEGRFGLAQIRIGQDDSKRCGHPIPSR